MIPVNGGGDTARDLLNYGWEMNAMQMGARYYFVEHMWGVPDLADTIFKQANRDIEGQSPFFRSSLQGQIFNLSTAIVEPGADEWTTWCGAWA